MKMRQLTIWTNPNERMNTCYNPKQITYAEWIGLEAKRLNDSNIQTEIRVNNRQEVGLFRTEWPLIN